jgi:hypothetical protein
LATNIWLCKARRHEAERMPPMLDDVKGKKASEVQVDVGRPTCAIGRRVDCGAHKLNGLDVVPPLVLPDPHAVLVRVPSSDNKQTTTNKQEQRTFSKTRVSESAFTTHTQYCLNDKSSK